MTFEQLGLSAPILKALKEQGYVNPSPIQEKAIPPALTGRDVLGCAQTGTGKTCAFAVPILQQLDQRPIPGRPIRALILTPTRELAIQIGESFDAYGKYLKLRHTVIFGGVGQNPQVEALKRGSDILVATPGRLMDLYQQGFVSMDKLEIFVLDEADRMLDMGFIHDVKKILKWLPAQKQTMLFSATMPGEVMELVNSLLRDPARVAVDPVSSPVEAIEQRVCFVDKGNKTRLLAWLLEHEGVKNALVFTRTKHGANKVARDLMKEGVTAAAIHGNKSQTARQQALSDFKAGRIQCLVATDIAARGLDIEELSHVFNYNLPEVPETYVHRIGRTGRAGRGGEAVSFCDFGEKPLLKDIEKLMGRSVPVLDGHPFPMQIFEAPKRDKNGKIINEEDAEARAAARQLKRERDQARQAAEKEKREKELARQQAAAQVLEQQEPALKSRRRRKKKAAPEPAAQVLPPVEDEPLDGYLPQRPKLTRPGTLLDTGDAMPNTEFTRPDPLDSDVIMDATARLLAPRKPLYGSSPVRDSRSPRKEGSRRKAAPQPRQEEQSPAPEQKPPKKRRSRKKSAAQPAGQQATAPQKGAAHQEQAQKERSGRGKKHSHDRGGRGPMEPHKSGQTKDSTEQASLIKPFYINVGR